MTKRLAVGRAEASCLVAGQPISPSPVRQPRAALAAGWAAALLLCLGLLAGCAASPDGLAPAPDAGATPQGSAASHASAASSAASLADVPAYAGDPWVTVNGNQPAFSAADLAAISGTEEYGQLDALGRCTAAFALVGPETQPTAKRSGQKHRPSGWVQAFYPEIGLDHLYERSHLLAHSLTGEDDNPLNLITGTAYLNHEGMYDFERAVDNYVDLTGNHVLMRVTPLFQGDELVARGVQMEAWSVEDEGEGVCLNVYCYNVQPGVAIDYATGRSWLEGAEEGAEPAAGAAAAEEASYVLNMRQKKAHLPDCPSVSAMSAANRREVTAALADLIAQGYDPCSRCLAGAA